MKSRIAATSLMRRQLDAKLEFWRSAPPQPREGWIRAIRQALGMPVNALARRMRVAPSTLTRLEQAERAGTISLRSLREAAEALDCEIVYALVPRRALQETLRQRALEVADHFVRRVSRTMSLEDQAVRDDETEHQRALLADQLMQTLDRRLWK
jgi:predicted DNA-binding mobile mystery protein A